MTHAAMTEEAQREAGIETTLLRLSVGIEHMSDLVSDVSGALQRTLKTANLPVKINSSA
jgi:cystathionine gamma-synthase